MAREHPKQGEVEQPQQQQDDGQVTGEEVMTAREQFTSKDAQIAALEEKFSRVQAEQQSLKEELSEERAAKVMAQTSLEAKEREIFALSEELSVVKTAERETLKLVRAKEEKIDTLNQSLDKAIQERQHAISAANSAAKQAKDEARLSVGESEAVPIDGEKFNLLTQQLSCNDNEGLPTNTQKPAPRGKSAAAPAAKVATRAKAAGSKPIKKVAAAPKNYAAEADTSSDTSAKDQLAAVAISSMQSWTEDANPPSASQAAERPQIKAAGSKAMRKVAAAITTSDAPAAKRPQSKAAGSKAAGTKAAPSKAAGSKAARKAVGETEPVAEAAPVAEADPTEQSQSKTVEDPVADAAKPILKAAADSIASRVRRRQRPVQVKDI